MFCTEAVDEKVVNDRARGRRECRVLSLSVNEFRGVVRDETIDERNCISPTHVQFAHVRDIEETRVRARSQMFLDSSGWIPARPGGTQIGMC